MAGFAGGVNALRVGVGNHLVAVRPHHATYRSTQISYRMKKRDRDAPLDARAARVSDVCWWLRVAWLPEGCGEMARVLIGQDTLAEALRSVRASRER